MAEFTREEIAALLNEYHPTILKFFLARIDGDSADAEECCQKVFLIFLNKQKENQLHFDNSAAVISWLYSTAQNVLKQYFQAIQAEKDTFSYYGLPDEIPDAQQVLFQPDFGAEPEMTKRELIRKLYADLDGQERHLFNRCFVQRTSRKKLAKELKMSENAVNQKVHRLRERLKAAYKKLWPQ